MDFVAIDFETANSNRSSACAVGIVEVQGGKIVFEQVWLINPQQHFDRMNIEIHGITPAMVADSPTFSELWPILAPLLKNKQVVAHNASFDMSVLRYCLDDAALTYPAFHYYCTYQLSKKLLPNMLSYRLNVLASHYQIPLNHHDALDDARAAALILARLLEQEQQLGPTELALAKGYKIGKMHARGYTPFSTTAAKSKKQAKPSTSASTKRTQASATETAAEKSGLQVISGQQADMIRRLGLNSL
ncbi:3'-5' exonuclease [Paenibacillus sp. FSL H8-0537]|uniref:3'-5' exonuclease n=1 Tax=Paenibacillus sp. FSL H8-0537 TaxID=2921399 RepID=UPI003100EFC8